MGALVLLTIFSTASAYRADTDIAADLERSVSDGYRGGKGDIGYADKESQVSDGYRGGKGDIGYADKESNVGNRRHRVKELVKPGSETQVGAYKFGPDSLLSEGQVGGGRECQLMGYPCTEDEVQVGGARGGFFGQASEKDVGMGCADYRRSEAEVGNRRNRVRELGRAQGYKLENQVGEKADSENAVAGGVECQLMGYCGESEVKVGVTQKLAEHALRSEAAAKESFFQAFLLPFFAGIGFASMVVYAYNIFNGKNGMSVSTPLLNEYEI